MTEWIKLVRKVNALTQQSKEQSTVGSVYCSALLADIDRLVNGGFGGTSTEALTNTASIIGAASAKLDYLVKEGKALVATHTESLDVIQVPCSSGNPL
jgi:hypothetical protein